MGSTYPVFKVDENFNKQILVFKQAVPKIAPRYFESNSRFHSLGQVSSLSLVDTLGIYEEGDAWVLTIVKVNINNSPQYIFLPFTSDIPQPKSSFDKSQIQTLGKAAFVFETNSPLYGKRQWIMVDAFTDYKFCPKLINLFLPWRGVSENHVNAYTTVYESGIGKFIFQTKPKQKIPLLRRWKYEFMDSCFVIKWDNLHLDLYQTLPALVDIKTLDTSSDVIGWITYHGGENLQLIIGILYKSTNGIASLKSKIASW
jgi:hypothetical protein